MDVETNEQSVIPELRGKDIEARKIFENPDNLNALKLLRQWHISEFRVAQITCRAASNGNTIEELENQTGIVDESIRRKLDEFIFIFNPNYECKMSPKRRAHCTDLRVALDCIDSGKPVPSDLKIDNTPLDIDRKAMWEALSSDVRFTKLLSQINRLNPGIATTWAYSISRQLSNLEVACELNCKASVISKRNRVFDGLVFDRPSFISIPNSIQIAFKHIVRKYVKTYKPTPRDVPNLLIDKPFGQMVIAALKEQ